MTRIRALCLLVGSAALGLQAAPAHAQFPERPVTVVIGFDAGGGADLTARAMQEEFSAALGQPVVIDNVPGAGGTVAATEVANADPDGYTMLLSPQGALVYQPNMRELDYSLDSFAPICRVYNTPAALMTADTGEYKTVPDLIAAAEAEPGAVTFASPGVGSAPHLAGFIFGQNAGVELTHVPFSGSVDMAQALKAGTVDVLADASNLVAQLDLVPIAVFGEERLETMPDVPTMAELGYPQNFSSHGGLLVPADTPEDVRQKLADACETALTSDATLSAFETMGVSQGYQPPEEYGEFLRSQSDVIGEAIEAAGLKQN